VGRLVRSLIAGALLGVGARAVMRVIGIVSGASEGFSWGGSFEVVLLGLLVGVPVALVFFALRRMVRWRAPWPGLSLGVLMAAGMALFPPPAARSAMASTADPPLVTAGLFSLLFVAFGLCLEWLWGRETPGGAVS
jgi:hypothetical protein